MKNHIHRFLTVIILGFAVVSSHGGTDSNAVTLVQIDSKDFGDTNSLFKIVEFERNTNISKLRLTKNIMAHQKMGSVGSSMFIMRGLYEIAKARGAEYFINLKEWDEKDGSWIYIVGFTNAQDADLKNEFGTEYDYKDEYGQKRGYMSVSKLKKFFER